MKLVPGGTNIVLAGAWNPAILSPDWMLREALGREPGKPEVIEALIPAGRGLALEYPRFTMPGFQYMCRPEALVVVPQDLSGDALAQVEAVLAQIVAKLSHTPLSGLGHNFEFVEDAPGADALDIFSAAQLDLVDAAPGLEATGTRIVTSLAKGRAIVNVTRSYDGTKLGMKFNFHYQISGSQDALTILTGADDRLASNLEQAKAIATELYGEIGK